VVSGAETLPATLPATLAPERQTRVVGRLTRISVYVVLVLVPSMAAVAFGVTLRPPASIVFVAGSALFLGFLVAVTRLAAQVLAGLEDGYPVIVSDRSKIVWCALLALGVVVAAAVVGGFSAAPLCALVVAAWWGALAPGLRAGVVALGGAVVVVVDCVTIMVTAGAPLLERMTSAVPSAVSAGLLVASTWFSGLLLRMVFDLDDARRRAGLAAVTEDRLRIARDLHDVVGRTLVVVGVKSELAAELMRRGGVERAGLELRQVRGLVDDASLEMRRVIGGYREPSLIDEVHGARALLRSAGVDFEVDGQIDRVPAGARPALAWALREAVTNALRHADPSWLRLGVAADRAVVVELRNDGVRNVRPGGGHGISGMRERIGALGGTVTTTVETDEFLLRIELPS
jgi:two-component system, NarL family, sensor histidine kinase DesK